MNTSTQDPVEARRRGRRAFLAAASSALGALGIGALVRPDAVLGGVNPPVYRNLPNIATATTSVMLSGTTAQLATGDAGVVGLATGDAGFGVRGHATGAHGISVEGITDGGIAQVAVLGLATRGDGDGVALKGKAKNGVGVWAEATGGHGLHVVGRAVFTNRSGKTTFSSGQAARTITSQYVGGDVMVLATIQGNVAGTWVRGVSLDVPNQRFTIRLNKAAPAQLVVGWFIVN